MQFLTSVTKGNRTLMIQLAASRSYRKWTISSSLNRAKLKISYHSTIFIISEPICFRRLSDSLIQPFNTLPDNREKPSCQPYEINQHKHYLQIHCSCQRTSITLIQMKTPEYILEFVESNLYPFSFLPAKQNAQQQSKHNQNTRFTCLIIIINLTFRIRISSILLFGWHNRWLSSDFRTGGTASTTQQI